MVLVMAVGPVDQAQLERLPARLSQAEQTRAERLKIDQHRWTYVAAHALLQRLLQAATSRRPREFVIGPHGRPELAPTIGEPALRFSLSHTEGLVAVALALGHDVGVDAERLEPATPIHDLARRYFARAEAAFIAEGEAPHSLSRFFRIWTAKEAVVKATGLGLRLPLDSFTITLDPLGASFHDDAGPHAGRWELQALGPTAVEADVSDSPHLLASSSGPSSSGYVPRIQGTGLDRGAAALDPPNTSDDYGVGSLSGEPGLGNCTGTFSSRFSLTLAVRRADAATGPLSVVFRRVDIAALDAGWPPGPE